MDLGTFFTTFGPVIAMAASAGVTYIIANRNLSDKIKTIAALLGEAGDEAKELLDTVLAAFKPDEDGSVRLTSDEVDEIRDGIIELFNTLMHKE